MWHESFQNWQSEWMSTTVLIVLTVYLRQKGSSQSKPVEEATYSQGLREPSHSILTQFVWI